MDIIIVDNLYAWFEIWTHDNYNKINYDVYMCV